MDRDKSVHKLAIFGGSFNPVHHGHLIMAEMAQNQFGLDKVIFVPAGISPFKDEPAVSGQKRLKMLRLAISRHPFFEASAIELLRSGPSYTIETVKHFEKKYPGAKLFFLLGSDTFSEINRWHQAEDLIRKLIFLVALRSSSRITTPAGFRVKYKLISAPLIEISSTLIRKLLGSGKSIRYLVPDSVYRYIRREGLYGLARTTEKN